MADFCGFQEGLCAAMHKSATVDGQVTQCSDWNQVCHAQDHGEAITRVPLTKEMIETLRAYREKTGVGSIALLKNQAECPENLTPRHIQSWLEGRLSSVPPEHLNYVLEKWEALPVFEFGIITEDIVDVLKGHWHRTKVGPVPLLKDATDKPEGLRPHTIAAWLNGRSRSYRKDHLKYVLERWSAMPGATNTSRVLSGYAEVTPAQRDRLHELKAKTGFGPQILMRGAKDAPRGLGSSKIMAWMDGTIKTAKPEHLAYVFARWESLIGKK